MLYRLREFGRLDFGFPPRWGTMDYDLVYAKIIIDDKKKLVVATFDDEVVDVLLRGFRTKRSLSDTAKSLTGKAQLHKGDKWDEELGIQLAKAQLLKNYTAYITSRVSNIVLFAEKWCQEANDAVGIAKEHNNKINAILNKRLQELNKKGKKNAGIKRCVTGNKRPYNERGQHIRSKH